MRQPLITRRSFIGHAASLLLMPFFAIGKARAETVTSFIKNLNPRRALGPAEDFTKYVNVMIGTGGHGHTYPGATVPFGAVQLSPDTGTADWDHCSGYHADDTSLIGFSHTHLSGTGCGDMLDFLIRPGAAKYQYADRARFSHADENAEPGYYSVLLREQNIKVELSATERTGIHRYTFPRGRASHLMLDLAHRWGTDEDGVAWSKLKVIGNDTIVGGRSTTGWANGRKLYFAMKVSRPFTKFEIYSDGQNLRDARSEAKGQNLQAVVYFETPDSEVIQVKVGISGVSAGGALKNLEKEIPDWDFDRVRQDAHSAWQSLLSRIRIESREPKQKQIFYTGLYHTMMGPTLFDDVDKRYRGMDQTIHRLKPDTHNYSTYSLWDTFRAVQPLHTLFLSDRVPDFVNSLIRMANESPSGLPVWPLQGIETGTMPGYHSATLIAEACVKDFTGIDYAKAYGPMKRRAFRDDYRGTALYRHYGYIPAEKEEESVSKTLEYAYNDWAIAHVANSAGASDNAKTLFRRSLNYKNLVDRETGFIRPKKQNGAWTVPFDPKDIGHVNGQRDYSECNAWQATFGVLHDPAGIIEQLGGPEAFATKLDALFNQSSTLPPSMPPDVTGMVGQYAQGNEPSHHIAYLYAYAGQAYKTQSRVHGLLRDMYSNQSDGLPGNDDCGQMSAWYIMSAMGFYAVDPVSGNYVFGTPLFDRVEIDLKDNKTLTLEALRASPNDIYIQSVMFNGQKYERSWFAHKDIQNGGHFCFEMGPQPNPSFGLGRDQLPPSASDLKIV